MAFIMVLVCGVFGFASALTSLLVFDASMMMALAIWSGFGLCLMMAGLAYALVSDAPMRAVIQPEIA